MLDIALNSTVDDVRREKQITRNTFFADGQRFGRIGQDLFLLCNGVELS